MVVCRNCQHDSSDPLFCDRCNSLLPAPATAILPNQVMLSNGRVVDCSGWNGVWPIDCRHPLRVSSDDHTYRLYALNRDSWRETSADIRIRAGVMLDVLAPVEVLPLEEGAIVVAEGLPGAGKPLLDADSGDEITCLESALARCRLLHRCLNPLHQAGLVWLNFDPEALEANDSAARLTNLDLQLFPAGACPDSMRLSSSYSPPEVCSFRADRIGPATDVFHVSLYLYYRLAGLLPNGFPGQGLEAFDFVVPSLRIYRPNLPVGIQSVLERGLARDPAMRFATVESLLDNLSGAVEQARARHLATKPVSWDCGSSTVVGRAHELQNLPNQDSHSYLSLGPDVLIAIVADGVTHAQIGSGEVASQVAVEMLACTLPQYLHETDVEEALTRSYLEASRAILELAKSVAPPGEHNPADMMSSTAIVGVLAGNELTLASVGDSRAYLIANGRAEQVTVDGDVRCTQLAAGWAPEQVIDMGTDASALYTCLGVGEWSSGNLQVCVARGTPRLSRLTLLPGDIVVLCSDGLVEEGVFLEPDELPDLVSEPAGQSAAEMASRLVATARSRHRDPSPWEPGGCGDDVTCIVLVIQSPAE